MKLKLFFLISTLAPFATHSYAQVFVEDAMKYAVLGPATGVTCAPNTKPCAILNKSADRIIDVKVEESFMFNNSVSTRVLSFDKIAPKEARYIGCVGKVQDGQNIKGTGYKIILASFEEADSMRVRRLLSDGNDNDTVKFKNNAGDDK